MTTTDIPEGFSSLFRSSPFLDTIGPLYSRGSAESLVVGLRIAPKHTNARGFAHGGVLSTLADIALGYAMESAAKESVSLVTASLALDYAGTAKLGDWIETSVDIQKIGSRLAFANAYLSVGSSRIVRAVRYSSWSRGKGPRFICKRDAVSVEASYGPRSARSTAPLTTSKGCAPERTCAGSIASSTRLINIAGTPVMPSSAARCSSSITRSR